MPAMSTGAADGSAATRPCRILVVDDEEPIRATGAEILDEEGYPVATAANGAEALHLVETTAPCTVLLDRRMPVLDGWGVMQALHARSASPAVVVMTAAQSAHPWAAEVGADGYVAKPFDLGEMVADVERLCLARATMTPE